MILTVVNLLLTIQNLLAQNGSDQVEFKHLTSADGLASNQTTCIQQDKNGFMWIGTKEGLSRYDGLHFINYFQNPADPAHSLSGNLVNGIFAHFFFFRRITFPSF